MPPIYFASTNKEKLTVAELFCKEASVPIEQISLGDIPEIQGESPREIIHHKALEAYNVFGKPLVVSDDSWNIPALNGFPGAYMKSINYWFQPEDFLRLMDGVTDRTVFIEPYLAYVDEHEVVIFEGQVRGTVLTKPRGTNEKSPIMSVVALEGDNGLSIAEVYEQGQQNNPSRLTQGRAWPELLAWYKEKHGK